MFYCMFYFTCDRSLSLEWMSDDRLSWKCDAAILVSMIDSTHVAMSRSIVLLSPCTGLPPLAEETTQVARGRGASGVSRYSNIRPLQRPGFDQNVLLGRWPHRGVKSTNWRRSSAGFAVFCCSESKRKHTTLTYDRPLTTNLLYRWTTSFCGRYFRRKLTTVICCCLPIASVGISRKELGAEGQSSKCLNPCMWKMLQEGLGGGHFVGKLLLMRHNLCYDDKKNCVQVRSGVIFWPSKKANKSN